MSLSKLNYTKDWRNPDDFPTYSSDETQIRADMQLLFDEARIALNKLIDDLDAAEIPFAPTPEIQAADVRQALIAIQNQIAQIALGNLPDNSISSQKIKPGAVTEEKMADLSVATRALADKSISEPKLGDVSVSTRTIQDGSVTRDKMSADAYNDKANLVNGRVAADELTRTVKYISESYTLVLDDLRKIIAVNPIGPVAVTIPSNTAAAFPVGAEIDILSRSDNDITIQGGSGVTLSGPVTLLSNAGGKARLVKIGTNEWAISVDEKATESGIEDSAVTNAKIADGAVSAGKIAAGAVTRAKLAQDALYSPITKPTTTTYNVVASDLGKTIVDAYSTRNNNLTWNLSKSLLDSSPIGTEIAFARAYTSQSITLSITGARIINADSGQVGGASRTVSFSLPEKGSMCALKKLENDSTYGSFWILTGNVEVVS